MELQRKLGLSGKNITGIKMKNEIISIKTLEEIKKIKEENKQLKKRLERYEKPKNYIAPKNNTGKILTDDKILDEFYNKLIKEEE